MEISLPTCVQLISLTFKELAHEMSVNISSPRSLLCLQFEANRHVSRTTQSGGEVWKFLLDMLQEERPKDPQEDSEWQERQKQKMRHTFERSQRDVRNGPAVNPFQHDSMGAVPLHLFFLLAVSDPHPH